MSDSILTSTKKTLGIDENYTAFDPDIMMHINAIFSTLNQLGVGPEEGFMIEGDDEEWSEFTNDDLKLNSVKTYVYFRTRLAFDPPATSFAISAIEKQITELEWRLNVAADPAPTPVVVLVVPEEELL